LSLDSLSITEKIILSDLILSHLVYHQNNSTRAFNPEDALQEIRLLSKNMFMFVHQHNPFFEKMYASILAIINNRVTYRTDFLSSFNSPKLDCSIYISAIVRSVYTIASDITEDVISLIDGALHRTYIIGGINSYSKVFSLLNAQPFKDFVDNCIKLLMLLPDYLVINKTKMSKKDKNGVRFITEIYIRFNITGPIVYADKVFLKFSLKPLFLLKNCFIGCSHLTICKPIKKAKHQFICNKIDWAALYKLIRTPIQIDFTYWAQIAEHQRQILQKKYSHLLEDGGKELSLTSLIEQLNRIYLIKSNELRIFKKKYNKTKFRPDILEDDDVYGGLVKQITNLKNLKIDESLRLVAQKSDEIEELHKDIQRLHSTIVIESLKTYDFPLYTGFYYDFRGRIYPDSFVSFLNLKQIRSLFLFKKSEFNAAKIERSNYYKLISSQNIKLDPIFDGLKVSEVNRYLVIMISLELGKLTKKFYKKEGASLQDFVDEGYRVFKQTSYDNIKFEDLGYVYTLKNSLTTFIEKGYWLNTTIIRDSTASSFQH
jgi:hypothetical protein